MSEEKKEDILNVQLQKQIELDKRLINISNQLNRLFRQGIVSNKENERPTLSYISSWVKTIQNQASRAIETDTEITNDIEEMIKEDNLLDNTEYTVSEFLKYMYYFESRKNLFRFIEKMNKNKPTISGSETISTIKITREYESDGKRFIDIRSERVDFPFRLILDSNQDLLNRQVLSTLIALDNSIESGKLHVDDVMKLYQIQKDDAYYDNTGQLNDFLKDKKLTEYESNNVIAEIREYDHVAETILLKNGISCSLQEESKRNFKNIINTMISLNNKTVDSKDLANGMYMFSGKPDKLIEFCQKMKEIRSSNGIVIPVESIQHATGSDTEHELNVILKHSTFPIGLFTPTIEFNEFVKETTQLIDEFCEHYKGIKSKKTTVADLKALNHLDTVRPERRLLNLNENLKDFELILKIGGKDELFKIAGFNNDTPEHPIIALENGVQCELDEEILLNIISSQEMLLKNEIEAKYIPVIVSHYKRDLNKVIINFEGKNIFAQTENHKGILKIKQAQEKNGFLFLYFNDFSFIFYCTGIDKQVEAEKLALTRLVLLAKKIQDKKLTIAELVYLHKLATEGEYPQKWFQLNSTLKDFKIITPFKKDELLTVKEYDNKNETITFAGFDPIEVDQQDIIRMLKQYYQIRKPVSPAAIQQYIQRYPTITLEQIKPIFMRRRITADFNVEIDDVKTDEKYKFLIHTTKLPADMWLACDATKITDVLKFGDLREINVKLDRVYSKIAETYGAKNMYEWIFPSWKGEKHDSLNIKDDTLFKNYVTSKVLFKAEKSTIIGATVPKKIAPFTDKELGFLLVLRHQPDLVVIDGFSPTQKNVHNKETPVHSEETEEQE